MAFRFTSGTLAVLFLAILYNIPHAPAQEEKTESRMQAVLHLDGMFLPDSGGLKITDAPTEGPGANLKQANNPTRLILERGDIITEIEGKKFRDRREFCDLMNEAHRKNEGKVRITVKDVSTSRSVVMVARPVVIRMDVPVANRQLDFLAELGKSVSEAPPVPTVPATIDP